MVRTLSIVACALLLSGTTLAEYMPGFSLYGHSALADSIVEVDVDGSGEATVVSVLAGKDPGKSFQVDPTRLRFRPKPGMKRAILFLSGGRPILDEAGVGWVEEKGVYLLPDNWGWCITWPFEYRPPTVEELRKSIAAARRDAAEIARIAGMKPGDARARALSALLTRKRDGIDWYRVEGRSLDVLLRRGPGKLGDENGGYMVELRTALTASLAGLAADERKILREAAAGLSPGTARREHVALLAEWGVGPEEFEFLERCFDTAPDLAEQFVCAGAMVVSDPPRALEKLESLLIAETPERTRGLLLVLVNAAFAKPPQVNADRVLDAAARIADTLPNEDGRMGTTNLSYVVVGALTRGGRDGDLTPLLTLARGKLACRGQALVNLQARFKCDWKKDDPRWDKAIRELTEK